MMAGDTIYRICAAAGRISGCHRRPDRSFFLHGRQFPVCARCAGVFAGECAAIIGFRLVSPPAALLVFFCAVMFLDWLIQYLNLRESTNTRRLITGILGGYAYFTFILRGLWLLREIFRS